jgi:hypothetical protein
MLTREILKDAQKCDNCHTCLARTELSKYSKYDKPNDWHYLCDLKIVIDSHIEALDEIERLKAEVAAKDKEVQHYMSSFANLALEHGRI